MTFLIFCDHIFYMTLHFLGCFGLAVPIALPCNKVACKLRIQRRLVGDPRRVPMGRLVPEQHRRHRQASSDGRHQGRERTRSLQLWGLECHLKKKNPCAGLGISHAPLQIIGHVHGSQTSYHAAVLGLYVATCFAPLASKIALDNQAMASFPMAPSGTGSFADFAG